MDFTVFTLPSVRSLLKRPGFVCKKRDFVAIIIAARLSLFSLRKKTMTIRFCKKTNLREE